MKTSVKFINTSLIELTLDSLNLTIHILLKPNRVNRINNIEILDTRSLSDGLILTDSTIKGTALLSLSDSNRITGILKMDGQTYSLTPIYTRNSVIFKRRKRSTSNKHVIQRTDGSDKQPAVCGNSFTAHKDIKFRTADNDSDNPYVKDANLYLGNARIKIAVFVDQILFRHKFNGDLSATKHFVVINVAHLERQLKTPKMLQNINISLVIVHFQVTHFYNTIQWDVSKYLYQFCRYANNRDTGIEADVNIMFTGSTLWWLKNGKYDTKVKGFAYVGQTCGDSSCILIEARDGYKSLRILSHEFGHNMGANHDGDINFNTTDCPSDKYIMAPEIEIEQNMWSDCSIKGFRRFLGSLEQRGEIGIECLANKTKPMSQDLTVTDSDLYKRPGLYISADKQCQMAFGPKFSYKHSQRTSICQTLKCRDDFFVVQTWGALEGTECGHNSQCTNGRCRRLTYDTDNYSASGRAIIRSRVNI